jgi:hypothetical protein
MWLPHSDYHADRELWRIRSSQGLYKGQSFGGFGKTEVRVRDAGAGSL